MSNDFGGVIGEGETAAGKKLSPRNGVNPRDVNASRARKVLEKSIGASTAGQTLPGVGRSVHVTSLIPLVSAPKTRTPRNARGEAARLSSKRVNSGVTNQSMS